MDDFSFNPHVPLYLECVVRNAISRGHRTERLGLVDRDQEVQSLHLIWALGATKCEDVGHSKACFLFHSKSQSINYGHVTTTAFGELFRSSPHFSVCPSDDAAVSPKMMTAEKSKRIFSNLVLAKSLAESLNGNNSSGIKIVILRNVCVFRNKALKVGRVIWMLKSDSLHGSALLYIHVYLPRPLENGQFTLT